MAREAKILIVSENRSQAGIKEAARDLLGIDDAAKKAGTALRNAFTVTAIVAAAKEVADFGFDCVKAFGESERAMIQLRTALGGSESSFARMNGLIGEMAGKTLASKDEIEALVAELASLGKTDADIDKITRASVALSNVTGGSLNEAYTKIIAAQAGQTKGLDKLIPAIGDFTKEQLAAGAATDLLNQKFGDISDAMSTGLAQSFSNLGKGWSNFKEALGENLEPLFSPMLGWIGNIVNRWTDAINETNRYRTALINNAELATALERKAAAQKNLDKWTPLYNLAAEQAGKVKGGQVNPELKEAYEKAMWELVAAGHAVTAAMNKTVPGSPSSRGSTSGTGSTGSESAGGFWKEQYDVGVQIQGVLAEWAAEDKAANESWLNEVEGLFRENTGRLGGGAGRPDNLSEAAMLPAFSYPDMESGQLGGGAGRPDNLSEAAMLPAFSYPDMESGQLGGGAGLSDNLSEAAMIRVMGPAEALFDRLAGPITAVTGGLLSFIAPLSSVQAIMDPLGVILKGVFDVLGPAIDSRLEPLIGALYIFGETIGKMLAPALESLSQFVLPIVLFAFQTLATILEVVMAPLRFFGDLLNWIGTVLTDFAWNVAHPFRKQNTAGDFSSDAFSGLEDRIAEIWKMSADDLTAAADRASKSTSGSTAGAGAVYSGAQAITFNFYNQGNVVGSGGLQELADMLDDIIQARGRYR